MLRRGKRGRDGDGSEGDDVAAPHHSPPQLACPICDAAMVIASEQSLAEFGDLDIKLHHLHCANCGMRVDRAFHPDVGYRALTR